MLRPSSSPPRSQATVAIAIFAATAGRARVPTSLQPSCVTRWPRHTLWYLECRCACHPACARHLDICKRSPNDTIQAHVCMHAAMVMRFGELSKCLHTETLHDGDDESQRVRAMFDKFTKQLHGVGHVVVDRILHAPEGGDRRLRVHDNNQIITILF